MKVENIHRLSGGCVRGDWSENPPAPLPHPWPCNCSPLYITSPLSPITQIESFTTPKVLEANTLRCKETFLVQATSQQESGTGVHHQHTAPSVSAHALPLPTGRTGRAPRARYGEGGGLSWAPPRKGGKSYYSLRLPLAFREASLITLLPFLGKYQNWTVQKEKSHKLRQFILNSWASIPSL